MKKIILLFAMMLAVAGVQAKTYKLYSTFVKPSNNNNISWDASTNTLGVWGENANTYQMFSFAAGTLSKYKQMCITINDNAHTQILFMNSSGETLHTWQFGSTGDKTETFANMASTASYGSYLTNDELSQVTEIRIKGKDVSSYSSSSPCNISIDPTKVYLETEEYEGNTTSFSSLTTGGTWPGTSLISLPADVSSTLQIVGKDSGTDNYADITAYHAIIFKISDFSVQGGGKLRAFVCKSDAESTLVTRYAHPISDTNVDNWSTEVAGPSANGYYYIDISDCSRLIGIKTNSYSTTSTWKIAEVYLVKTSLTITDGFDMANMVNDPIGAAINYDREFTGGQKYTVCLPFSTSGSEAGGTFYEFSSVSDETLNFTALDASTATTAYTPYIFVPSGTLSVKPFANLSNKDIVASSGATTTVTKETNYTFKGTLAHSDNVQGDNGSNTVFGLKGGDGTFVKVTGTSVAIDAFRAYIIVSGSAQARALTRGFFDVNLGDGTTSIQKTETQTEDIDAPAYNLSGQRVDANYKGLVIKNGRKYFVK